MAQTPSTADRPDDSGEPEALRPVGVGPGREDFAQQVHDALAHLNDPLYLQAHPLVRFVRTDLNARSSSLGRALQQALLDTIESLRPDAVAVPNSRALRRYQVLRLRFVEGLGIPQVLDRLSISRSGYFLEQQQALKAIASQLFDTWLGSESTSPSARESGRESAADLERGREQVRREARAQTNLPLQLTSFVGREREIAEVKRLLKEHRLVTLTGSGGCGKTRLALEVARELLEEFPNGVWSVELASLADSALVPQSVALGMGVREVPGIPIESTLSEHLRRKHLLLVLDSCEHLLEACAELAESLLRSCPDMRILATSREPLGVYGEMPWRVPSLAAPDPGQSLSLERLAEYDAVRLLVERARLVRSGFELTEANAAFVAEVCWRLDGIPLAVELAAARLQALSLEQISARLDDRFLLLTGGRRTGLPRQQTLRGTLDWSHQLLSGEEQVVFRRLAVFSGGWRLEAAEAVCGGEGLETATVLDSLTQLVRKSLVVVEEVAGRTRYRLLETIREYAWEQMRESGEEGTIRDRHKAWCLSFLAPPESLKSRSSLDWAVTIASAYGDEVELEDGNLRAALGWCLDVDPSSGLGIARLLWLFWIFRGHSTEGRRWLEDLLARAPERTIDRALALVGTGQLAEDQGDLDRAESAAEESVSIFREHGDQLDICWALTRLGTAALEKGDFPRARILLEESLALSRRNGDRHSEYRSLARLGYVSWLTGDSDRTLRLYEEASFVAQSLEVPRSPYPAEIMGFLGRVWVSLGDYVRARRLLEEGVSEFRRLGRTDGLGWSLPDLGHVLALKGEYDLADALLRECFSLLRVQGNRPRTCRALYIYGLLANGRGDNEKGCRLIAVASVRHPAPETILDSTERAEIQAALTTAKAALGEEAFARAFAEGQAMTLEQAVEYALRDDEARDDKVHNPAPDDRGG